MGITINLSSLRSRVIRTAATSVGIRRFATSGSMIESDEQGGASCTATAIQLFGALRFSVTAIVNLCVSIKNYVMNFNWNMGLDEANANLKSGIESLAGSFGGLLGASLGYLVCGAVPGILMFKFNEALALHVLKEVGEEAVQELAGRISGLIRQSSNVFVRGLIEYGYVAVTSGAKGIFTEVTNTILTASGRGQRLEQAKKTKKEPWSFNKGIEDFVESIPVQAIQNFVENFLEEADEACIEAGYVVAGSIDAYLAANQMSNRNILGEEQAVEVVFNRETLNQQTPTQ